MAVTITSGDILNQEQLSKHIKVFAGPGAGKTHFLVENIKSIVATHPYVAKSRARKLLCITYTNAAVDEIRRRLDRFSDAVEISTIHGFIIEHIILPFQEELKKTMESDFGIKVNTKAKISSQIEGLSVLHGFEKEEIYEYVAERTTVATPLSYSKKKMGDVQADIAYYLSDKKSRLVPVNGVDPNHQNSIKEFTWAVARKISGFGFCRKTQQPFMRQE